MVVVSKNKAYSLDHFTFELSITWPSCMQIISLLQNFLDVFFYIRTIYQNSNAMIMGQMHYRASTLLFMLHSQCRRQSKRSEGALAESGGH